jgi:hypothetical protein
MGRIRPRVHAGAAAMDRACRAGDTADAVRALRRASRRGGASVSAGAAVSDVTGNVDARARAGLGARGADEDALAALASLAGRARATTAATVLRIGIECDAGAAAQRSASAAAGLTPAGCAARRAVQGWIARDVASAAVCRVICGRDAAAVALGKTVVAFS